MSDFFCKSGSGVTAFSTSQLYATGDRVVPTYADATTNVDVARTAVWECTTGGTTNGAMSWPASATYDSTTATQNGVVFTARKPGYSSGSTVNWTFATPHIKYLLLAMNTESPAGRGLISDGHAESLGAAVNSSEVIVGTLTNPAKFYCVDDSVTSNFTVATTASLATTTSGAILFGGCYECYGLNLSAGTGGSSGSVQFHNTNTNSGYARWESAEIRLTNTSTGGTIHTGTSQARQRTRWVNCTVYFSGTGQDFNVRGDFEWEGGGVTSGSSTPVALFLFGASAGIAGRVSVKNVDFSNFANTFTLVDPSSATTIGTVTLENCKFPSGWDITSSLVTGGAITQPGFRVELVNCDAGDTNYRTAIEDYTGSIRDSTTVVATGGATDGTTLKSFKMVTTSQAGTGRWNGLETNPISIWNETIGSGQTATFELIADVGSLLTNAEFYTRLDYLGTSGFPLGLSVSNIPATPLTTAANLTASTKAWDSQASARANSTAYALGDALKVASNSGRVFFCTTAGTTNGSEPVGYASAVDGGSVTDGTAVFRAGMRMKVALTFTAEEKGPVSWKHVLNKASTTAYVDRDVTLS